MRTGAFQYRKYSSNRAGTFQYCKYSSNRAGTFQYRIWQSHSAEALMNALSDMFQSQGIQSEKIKPAKLYIKDMEDSHSPAILSAIGRSWFWSLINRWSGPKMLIWASLKHKKSPKTHLLHKASYIGIIFNNSNTGLHMTHITHQPKAPHKGKEPETLRRNTEKGSLLLGWKIIHQRKAAMARLLGSEGKELNSSGLLNWHDTMGQQRGKQVPSITGSVLGLGMWRSGQEVPGCGGDATPALTFLPRITAVSSQLSGSKGKHDDCMLSCVRRLVVTCSVGCQPVSGWVCS